MYEDCLRTWHFGWLSQEDHFVQSDLLYQGWKGKKDELLTYDTGSQIVRSRAGKRQRRHWGNPASQEHHVVCGHEGKWKSHCLGEIEDFE